MDEVFPFMVRQSSPRTACCCKGKHVSFWIYLLRCADGSYYTGHTDNLEKRIQEHHNGEIKSCYTFHRRPLQLLFSQDFPTRQEALASERQIKGWSRKKKEAMIQGNWKEVSRFARSPNSQGYSPVGSEPVEGRMKKICDSKKHEKIWNNVRVGSSSRYAEEYLPFVVGYDADAKTLEIKACASSWIFLRWASPRKLSA